jgi:hypothetical protein
MNGRPCSFKPEFSEQYTVWQQSFDQHNGHRSTGPMTLTAMLPKDIFLNDLQRWEVRGWRTISGLERHVALYHLFRQVIDS